MSIVISYCTCIMHGYFTASNKYSKSNLILLYWSILLTLVYIVAKWKEDIAGIQHFWYPIYRIPKSCSGPYSMRNPAGFNKNLAQDPTGFKVSCTSSYRIKYLAQNPVWDPTGFEISCTGSYRISNSLHRMLCEILHDFKFMGRIL